MMYTMSELCDIKSTIHKKVIEEEISSLLGEADSLVSKAMKSGKEEDLAKADAAKEKCQQAFDILMILNSVSDVWSGVPINKGEGEDGTIFNPMGCDRPKRSAFLGDDGLIVCGNIIGNIIAFNTFSTNEDNAMNIIMPWIVHGKTPMDK